MNHLHTLFLKELQANVLEIIDSSKGVDQEVKRVKTNKGEFIYKKPLHESDKIIKEKIGCAIATKQNIPAPQIVFFNDVELIETAIPGKIISEWQLTKEERLTIFRKVGILLARFHQARTEGFGKITAQGKGEYNTLKEFLHSWLDKELITLEKEKVFSNETLQQIKTYFSNKSYLTNDQESVYIHADITDYNILIDEKQEITGFVDFGDLLAGPPEMDFATWTSETDDLDEVEALMEGYGTPDREKVAYYSAAWIIWMINDFSQNNKIEKVNMLSKRLVHILNEG